jgi:hypothetical protein
VVTADAIGGPLTLRHASKRSSGTWGPDDYDVIHDGRDIGRIFMPRAEVPADYPWMWTITGAVVMPHFPSHGFCASLEEAKAKFCRDVARMVGWRSIQTRAAAAQGGARRYQSGRGGLSHRLMRKGGAQG